MTKLTRAICLLILPALALGACTSPTAAPPPVSSPTSQPSTSTTEPTQAQTATSAPEPVSLADSCLIFNGGQFAEASGSLIPLKSAFTVEAWVYDQGDNGGFVEFISQGKQPGPFYLGTTQGSGVIRAGDAWGDTGKVMPKNAWTHLAVTKSDSARGTLYINGESVGSTSGFTFGSGGTPFRLGRQFGDIGEHFTGCMDEVKIFSVARSAEQIKSDMQKTDGAISEPDLIAYYNFNDTSDPSIIRQANGSDEYALKLSVKATWSLADQVGSQAAASRLSVSSEIGLSNCQDGGCGAYIDSSVSNIKSNYRMGYSWYSTVWPLLTESPDPKFQMGLGSTWLLPDLHKYQGQSAFNQAIESVCNGFGADWGDGQWNLFQSVEGGLGYWSDTHFKSAMPKWRFNATTDCYGSPMHSAPGWPFGNTTPLGMDQFGLVQLSNRMLIAPDGQTFPLTTYNQVLGVAWIALPFPEVAGESAASPTGSNAWTLFMNSQNFKGPLAYYVPQYFSAQSQRIPGLVGLGLDANPGFIGSMASEIGWMSMVEATDQNGTTYARIPQLRFPVDSQGRSILSQDIRSYSEDAVAAQFTRWLNGETDSFGPFAPSGTTNLTVGVNDQPKYYQHNDPVAGLSQQFRILPFDNGNSYGLQWADAASNGYFPTYFRDDGNSRTIISADQVPADTFLTQFSFGQAATRKATYQSPNWWDVATKSVPGGTVTLSDGSTLTYVWFKFVDQPALRNLKLSEADRQSLQAMVERMQRTWPIDGEYMPPPTSGALVSFDPALLVTPPAGYEYGYVPIVIQQTGNVVGPPLP